MQKNKLIRNLDKNTIEKLNNLCKILDLSQAKTIELVLSFYLDKNKKNIKEKLFKLIS